MKNMQRIEKITIKLIRNHNSRLDLASLVYVYNEYHYTGVPNGISKDQHFEKNKKDFF